MELSELRNLTAERIVLFSLLLLGAAVLLVVAFFVGLPVVPLAPAKLAMPLTLSSLLALTAFSSLRGLPAQLSSMLRGDSAPISTALILSMAFCLYSAFIGSYVFTTCAAVLQVGTVIAYTVSAFPGGATGAKFLASSLGSTVLRSLGLSLGERARGYRVSRKATESPQESKSISHQFQTLFQAVSKASPTHCKAPCRSQAGLTVFDARRRKCHTNASPLYDH
jgi:hypothetical protein